MIKITDDIFVQEFMLKDYINGRIERANFLYKRLFGEDSHMFYSQSKDGCSRWLKDCEQYEDILEMFRQLNIFNWIDEDQFNNLI